MPVLTRWLIKSSFVYLVAALVVGTALAVQAIVRVPGFVSALTPVYFHLFMLGWVSQLIFGVIYWMFPKYSKERPRGSEPLGWATYGLLNAGLVVRAIGEPAQAVSPSLGLGWLLAGSAVLQWLAGMAFVANTWVRVKER